MGKGPDADGVFTIGVIDQLVVGASVSAEFFRSMNAAAFVAPNLINSRQQNR